MEIFRLLPIDWQAVAAITTFLAVAVALYSSYQYRKRERMIEKREIIERIIQPLRENTNSLLSVGSGLFSPYFSNWKLKWRDIQKGNPYLVYKLAAEFKNLLNRFDENLSKFQNLTNQKLPKLNKVITDIVGETLSLVVNEESAIASRYQGKIGGNHFSVSFLNLLLAKKNLDDYMEEELKCDSTLPNTELSETQFIVPGFDKKFTKEIFDDVFIKVKSLVESDEELKSYIKSWIFIIDEAKRLAAEIKKYEV